MPWQEVGALTGSSSPARMGQNLPGLVIQAQPLPRPGTAGMATVPGVATAPGMAINTRGGHQYQGWPQRQGWLSMPGTLCPWQDWSPAAPKPSSRCPGAPIHPSCPPMPLPGTPHTPDPPVNAQNRRHLTNNQLRSAATGTSPARAPEVAFTADSHQRNFQK